MSNIFVDSKTFVDMPTSRPESQVLAAFSAISGNYTKKNLLQFLDDNFHEPGYDLIIKTPIDWKEEPKFIKDIRDPELSHFGKVLHLKWKSLTRQFNYSMICEHCTSSSFKLEHPFVIPGGRFRESYYWDTFWIIEGLIQSEMFQTIQGMLRNFFNMVNLYGFVPNGSRIYYLNRSRPPLLTQMVFRLFETTNDFEFLKEALPIIDREYQFWMAQRSIKVNSAKNETFILNYYKVVNDFPRPESYKEDFQEAISFPNEKEKIRFFSEIVAATESGWDFSSRWLKNSTNLKTIRTSEIVPVDLNTILYKNELILSKMHGLVNDTSMELFYKQAAESRLLAINQIFWNSTVVSWRDLILNGTGDHFYISNIFPLFYGIVPPNADINSVIMKHETMLRDYPAGIPTSDFKDGQQWDFPNAWAPYHLIAVNFLKDANLQLALDISQRFVNTVYCGWNRTGYIFEKYNAEKVGSPGGGGEYIVQEGFGWTNGVVISLLALFGNKLVAPVNCTSMYDEFKNKGKNEFLEINSHFPKQLMIFCSLVILLVIFCKKIKRRL